VSRAVPADPTDDAASPAIGVIGDLHSAWDEIDVDYFNGSRYPLLLFTGDLGGSGARDGLRIAKSLSHLTRPALVMLGNNDVEQYARVAAELTYRRSRAGLMGDLRSEPPPPPGSGHAETCGYSSHHVRLGAEELTIIAGRPFAMGGSELSFSRALEESYGVQSLADSTARLKELVDGASTRDLLFLSHNGPSGLGGQPSSLWGSDFRREGGDWGDADLTGAIAHARARERRTLAVIAGHMHWSLKGGGLRESRLERAGTLYVNAARVPRIVVTDGQRKRHHLALSMKDGRASVQDVVVSG
jgi:uncharacterized protein (TIGR04168 family)